MEFKVTKSQWAAAAWGDDTHTEHGDQQKEEGVLPGDFECHCNIFPGGDNQVKDRVSISDNEWCLSDQFYRVTHLLDLAINYSDGESFGERMTWRRAAKTMAERFLAAGKEAGYDTNNWVSGL